MNYIGNIYEIGYMEGIGFPPPFFRSYVFDRINPVRGILRGKKTHHVEYSYCD